MLNKLKYLFILAKKYSHIIFLLLGGLIVLILFPRKKNIGKLDIEGKIENVRKEIESLKGNKKKIVEELNKRFGR